MPIEKLIPMTRNSSNDNITVRSFQLRADTIDESNRSVEAVIATEEPVLAFDLRSWATILEVLRVDGIQWSDDGQVPLLDTHDRSSIGKMLGSTRDFKVVGNTLVARNYYADDGVGGLGNKAWALVQQRHLRDNSVGYEPIAFTDIEPGETATVEGKTYTAPATRVLRITTASRVKENSNCPIGADPDAKMRGDNTNLTPPKTTKESIMDKELRKFLEQRGMPVGASEADAIRFFWEAEDAVRAAAPSQLDASTKPQAAPAQRTSTNPAQPLPFDAEAVRSQVRQEVAAEIEACRTAEAQRCAAIRKEGTDFGIAPATVERCINEGLDISAARGEFLAAERTNRTGVAPGINVDDQPGAFVGSSAHALRSIRRRPQALRRRRRQPGAGKPAHRFIDQCLPHGLRQCRHRCPV